MLDILVVSPEARGESDLVKALRGADPPLVVRQVSALTEACALIQRERGLLAVLVSGALADGVLQSLSSFLSRQPQPPPLLLEIGPGLRLPWAHCVAAGAGVIQGSPGIGWRIAIEPVPQPLRSRSASLTHRESPGAPTGAGEHDAGADDDRATSTDAAPDGDGAACARAEVERSSSAAALIGALRALQPSQAAPSAVEIDMVVQGRETRDIRAMLPSIAQSSAPVLIRGESGTGKELLAHEIHRRSPRRQGPFVALNCGAIPAALLESELFGVKKGAFTGATSDRRGLLSEANGGTLLLDEIGEMPLVLQVKLLRFLQDGEVRAVGDVQVQRGDVRVIAATNRPLEEDMATGRFRTDLFYRLNVLPLFLPPLRARLDELPALVEHFLAKYRTELRDARPRTLHPRALERLRDYAWPGNIRELEGVIRRAMVLTHGTEIGASDLRLGSDREVWEAEPLEAQPYRLARQEVLNRFEVAYVKRLLQECEGNVPQAAERAGQDRKSFWRIMTRHDIDPADFRKG